MPDEESIALACLYLLLSRVQAEAARDPDDMLHARIGANRLAARVVEAGEELRVLRGTRRASLRLRVQSGEDETASDDTGVLRAPMPGRVVSVHAAAGDTVRHGQPLIVIEAMKMERTLSAPFDGCVESLSCAAGESVDGDVVLATLRPNEEPLADSSS